jgi:hypothetical protein
MPTMSQEWLDQNQAEVTDLAINSEEYADLALKSLAKLDNPERALLEHDQTPCPVTHHFGPNLCIREVFMPAGILAIGHCQKFDHMNILLKGKVMVVGDNGNLVTLTAPLMFVGKPGRKVGYVLEDVIWQNIYATDLKDIDAVEDQFIEKSLDWQADADAKFAVEAITHNASREDYLSVLSESGITHEIARQQTENEDDRLDVDNTNIRVSKSPIDGLGLYVTVPVKAGDIICQARINGMRTQAGRYTNHAIDPNAKMVLLPNGDIDLVALVDLAGCEGGGIGTEATIDYRQALSLSGIEFEGVKLCQA